MKKKVWKKQFIAWIGAFVLSFLIVNGVMFFYYKRPAWISRDMGASIGIYYPEKSIVYAYEGFGINETDKNGYVNPNVELASNYVLVMGSSHTQGKEVMSDERYSNLINKKITEGKRLYVYNIAIDANYFPSIVKHFEAALQEFPDSEAVVIEIGYTDFEEQELEDSLISVPYSKDTVGSALVDNMNLTQKVEVFVKEAMPLVVLLAYKQLASIDLGFEGMFCYTEPAEASEIQEAGNVENVELLDQSIEKLRESYKKPIIIVYHPEIRFTKEGKMEIVRDNGVNEFKNICEKYEISFLDLGNEFLYEYDTSLKYPYGFANTAPGTGHLNRNGHQMIADTVYKELVNYGIIDKLMRGENK